MARFGGEGLGFNVEGVGVWALGFRVRGCLGGLPVFALSADFLDSYPKCKLSV